jgi:hypothetical protein
MQFDIWKRQVATADVSADKVLEKYIYLNETVSILNYFF